jgi:hypothetical protein
VTANGFGSSVGGDQLLLNSRETTPARGWLITREGTRVKQAAGLSGSGLLLVTSVECSGSVERYPLSLSSLSYPFPLEAEGRKERQREREISSSEMGR